MNLDSQFTAMEARMREVDAILADPAVTRDPRRYAETMRKRKELAEVLDAFHDRRRLAEAHRQAREMIEDDDPEMAAMAREEIDAAAEKLAAAEERLSLLLLPRDPNDAKNTIVEIRAGTGGDEAGLFAGDLFRMYTRFAEIQGWRCELISASESDLGGFKEVIFSVSGENVFSRLKFEGGTHRVQRVPATETQGRIHTSAVTVAVMPEAEEVDIAINPADLRFDVFRSSGPGGQSVNTTDSAVRITHIPTGLVVSCQDEKSQLKNKQKGLKVLRARLYDRMREEEEAKQSAARKAQVGSGDRSGRIRTYNFPQNRLSDHRINLTLYNLDQVMEGQLNQVVEPLITYMQAEMLKNAG